MVERGCRFVEDQDAGIADQRTRNGHALALAARQRDAALADRGVVALRHFTDEVVGAGEL